MRYLLTLVALTFSVVVYADDRLKNEIDAALATYQVLENQALTEYYIDLNKGMKEQVARRKYFNRELSLRAKYYDICDTACLRFTNHKCRWN